MAWSWTILVVAGGSAALAFAPGCEGETAGSSADTTGAATDATGAGGASATGGTTGSGGPGGGGGNAAGCTEGPATGAGGCASTCVEDADCGTVYCGCGPASGTTPSKKCWDGCCPELDVICDWACKDAFGCDAGHF
jgi:hypothetical protein